MPVLITSSIPSDYEVFAARGNGSCGPNSLSIQFVCYLFAGVYKKHSIDLTEFSIAWNLYYCDNQISLNYETCTDDMPILLHDRVYEKISQILKIDQGSSLQDCEALLAPLLRFYYLTYRHINSLTTEEELPLLQKRTLTFCFEGNELYFQDLAKQLKLQMSRRLLSTRYSDTSGTDNSPSYRSFFESSAMEVLAFELLSFRLSYAMVGKSDSGARDYAQSLKHQYMYAQKNFSEEITCQTLAKVPAQHFFWFAPETIQSLNDLVHEHALLAVVINYSGQHFNPVLPRFICANETVQSLVQNTRRRRCVIHKSDNQLYNPSNIPENRVVRTTPPSTFSWIQREIISAIRHFHIRLWPKVKYALLGLSAAISFIFYPLLSFISCTLIYCYVQRRKIYHLLKSGIEQCAPTYFSAKQFFKKRSSDQPKNHCKSKTPLSYLVPPFGRL